MLLFPCSATFRKMFPEYVEKYNQQQLSEQVATEQRETRHDKSSRSVSEKNSDSTGEDMKKVEGLKDVRRNKKQPFPTWVMLLLFSIFGVVMALPLLQLWIFMDIRVHKGFSWSWFFMFYLGFLMSNKICIGNIRHGGCVKNLILLLCVYVVPVSWYWYLLCHAPLEMFEACLSSSVAW